jgi:hypothetical protein
MKRLARLSLAAMVASLGACETTGDPQRGGLFGWSETQARQRQARKQSAVAGATAELSRESDRSAAFDQRRSATDRQITAARHKQQLAEDRLHAQRTALVARTEHLDEDCPTAATASRARAKGRELARRVNTIAANPSLTVAQRAEMLRQLEAEIDDAREPRQK